MATQTVGGIKIYDAAASLQGGVAAPTGSDELVLVRVGAYAGAGPTAAARAESVAFDASTGRLLVTNAVQDQIDIFKLNADGSLTLESAKTFGGVSGFGTINSVAVKNGVIAVAVDNSDPSQPGKVLLLDSATGDILKEIVVGVVPDQVTFTPDGKKILVANEAETVSPANNPLGSISIIDISAGAANPTVTTVDFTALNGSEAVLKAQGLALFSGQAAGADIEPEYITVSPDGTRAYVTLQEVNAVAVLDLTNPSATAPISIQPLGYIDRNLAGNEFDASDRDGIDIANADVLSAPQPDAIASWSVEGVTYFITANEGDARVGGLLDEKRLNDATVILDPTAYPDAAALKNNNNLGRLNIISNQGDTDNDGDIDQIYTFGGRGVSIFRQEADGSITKVRETGSEFEKIIARDLPTRFNAENGSAADDRSDNKGPEPEGVTIGKVGDKVYAFVTLERIGGVIVYDVTNPETASYVTYKPATSEDYAPEVVTFISAADSPTGTALVISANEVSGTTTVYKALAQTEGDDELSGSAVADSFNAKGGADTLKGLGGNDVLKAGAGADKVDGGEGSDWIDGGADSDLLTGGAGPDVFVFDNLNPTGKDKITDFSTEDFLVTTAKIFDSNNDGIIKFSGNKLLDLAPGSNVQVTSDLGKAVLSLEFDGSTVQDGVTYYVYSRVGSTGDFHDLPFFDDVTPV